MQMIFVIVVSLFLVACGNQEGVVRETNPLKCISAKIVKDLRATGKVNDDLIKNFKDEVLKQAETLEKSDPRQVEIRAAKSALIKKVEAVRLMVIVEPKLRRISQMSLTETEFSRLMGDLK